MTIAASTDRQNRLAKETSPYLLQHRHNPVDWWAWGLDALAEAKRLNKPILLSIGYAACHWCHVMAHESFEDEATAEVMNRLFVNIKVDREERPEVDQIYMAALHHLGQQGGWPLTMILTPTGEPVWGGTYFPKVSRYGRPGFVDVLEEIARLFREEPHRIQQNRDALMTALAAKARAAKNVTIGVRELDNAAIGIARAFDPVNGGLGHAPKFPQCSMLEVLWRAGMRRSEERYFELVEITLEHMCQGGIFDHLGGGFSRYCVDDEWLVPHFEKMLYDNAQLLEMLALAHVRTGRRLFHARAVETVAWLMREMTTSEGAFCASVDADSEGEEGKFYLWSRAEIDQILGKSDADYIARIYDVTEEGNFEGRNILNRLNNLNRASEPIESSDRTGSSLPSARSMETDTLRNGNDAASHQDDTAQQQYCETSDDARLVALRQLLLNARNKRTRPALDDKILADWNGMMIAALVNAGIFLRQLDWLNDAKRAYTFVSSHMTRGDRLGHSWRDGKLLFPGLASDHAAMIRAALTLHQATGDCGYLDDAVRWQTAFDRHYGHRETGGYYLAADDAQLLVVRPDPTVDDATPNPNSIAAQNLIRLAALTGEGHWRERTDALFDGLLPIAAQNTYSHASLLNALDVHLRAIEIVAIGPAADRFADAALALPFPDHIVTRAINTDDLPAEHPARTVSLVRGRTVALICTGQHCSLPISDVEQLGRAVAAARRSAAIQ